MDVPELHVAKETAQDEMETDTTLATFAHLAAPLQAAWREGGNLLHIGKSGDGQSPEDGIALQDSSSARQTSVEDR